MTKLFLVFLRKLQISINCQKKKIDVLDIIFSKVHLEIKQMEGAKVVPLFKLKFWNTIN